MIDNPLQEESTKGRRSKKVGSFMDRVTNKYMLSTINDIRIKDEMNEHTCLKYYKLDIILIK